MYFYMFVEAKTGIVSFEMQESQETNCAEDFQQVLGMHYIHVNVDIRHNI